MVNKFSALSTGPDLSEEDEEDEVTVADGVCQITTMPQTRCVRVPPLSLSLTPTHPRNANNNKYCIVYYGKCKISRCGKICNCRTVTYIINTELELSWRQK